MTPPLSRSLPSIQVLGVLGAGALALAILAFPPSSVLTILLVALSASCAMAYPPAMVAAVVIYFTIND
jgi:hypothetical protein